MANGEPSFVYVIGSDSGPKKIGISRDPHRRAAAMGTANPARIKVLHAVSHPNAAYVEALAHQALSDKRTNGEWFDITTESAVYAIEAAMVIADGPPVLAGMITPAQCRAARGLIDWSQERLAGEAGVGLSTVRNFEKGRSAPVAQNMAAIIRTLEAAGVRFGPGPANETGVWLDERK